MHNYIFNSRFDTDICITIIIIILVFLVYTAIFERPLMEMDAAVPVESNLAIITSLSLTPWHEQAFWLYCLGYGCDGLKFKMS